jgi:hypothetical protein
MADGRYIATVPAACFICEGRTRWQGDIKSRTEFRGQKIMVCVYCRAAYQDAVAQASTFGRRFRFVRKEEIPKANLGYPLALHVCGDGAFRQIYKVLLLCKERQISRKKEVNWMADEMARKLLKLPNRVAAAMKGTFAICGDDAKVADDVALLMIKDLLEEIDPDIFRRPARRKEKRLS